MIEFCDVLYLQAISNFASLKVLIVCMLNVHRTKVTTLLRATSFRSRPEPPVHEHPTLILHTPVRAWRARCAVACCGDRSHKQTRTCSQSVCRIRAPLAVRAFCKWSPHRPIVRCSSSRGGRGAPGSASCTSTPRCSAVSFGSAPRCVVSGAGDATGSPAGTSA